MSPLVEEQMLAEGELCHALYRLIIGHRFSAYEVRDVVDMLSGQFYRNPRTWRAADPSPEELADFAFRGVPIGSVDRTELTGQRGV